MNTYIINYLSYNELLCVKITGTDIGDACLKALQAGYIRKLDTVQSIVRINNGESK